MELRTHLHEKSTDSKQPSTVPHKQIQHIHMEMDGGALWVVGGALGGAGGGAVL